MRFSFFFLHTNVKRSFYFRRKKKMCVFFSFKDIEEEYVQDKIVDCNIDLDRISLQSMTSSRQRRRNIPNANKNLALQRSEHELSHLI